MKIEFSAEAEKNVDEDFRGVATSSEGEYIWIICDDGAVCLGAVPHDNKPCLVYDRVEWKEAFIKQGPFTKYNGVVTISN